MTRVVHLLAYACGHGGPDSRCASGPGALQQQGLLRRSNTTDIAVQWTATITPHRSEASRLRAIAGACKQLAAMVSELAATHEYFAVIGGDHTSAIGTWNGARRGLAKRGPIGLVWIDAHMDSHTPQTTPSGALHGMPLACLLGYGAPELLAPEPALRPEHVCLIGVRSYEREEEALLSRLGVRVFFMEEIRRRGLDAVFSDALGIARQGTAGFGVSIDLDAVDPRDAPAVGSPAAGGLRAAELLSCLPHFGRQTGLLGIEIAEFNPYLDHHGRTARLIRDLLAASQPERERS